MRSPVLRGLLAASLLLLAAPASAQLFRTYLASDGSDANPCTLPQPCRLLPAALAAVSSGGEIWMLDSANFNTGQVDITKSVSILAVPGAVGSLISTGAGHALFVDTPGVKLSLRNLVIAHFPGGSSVVGVAMMQGAELHVADCEFVNLAGYAIASLAANSSVTVKATRIRSATGSGVYVGPGVIAHLSRVDIAGGNWAIRTDGDAQLNVVDSVIAGAGVGVYAVNGVAAARGRVLVERTLISETSSGINAQTTGSGAIVEVMASGNAISHSTYGIMVNNQSSGGASATVVADNNRISHTSHAFYFLVGTGTILSRGNNTVRYSAISDVGGGGSVTGLPGL